MPVPAIQLRRATSGPPLAPTPAPAPRRLDWSFQPHHLLAAWPSDCPLASLVSGGVSGPRSRWSIFACPIPAPHAGHALLPTIAPASAPDNPRVFGSQGQTNDPALPPYSGTGWIGWLSYDAGARFEPTALAPGPSAARADRPWPPACWQRVEGALAHDRASGQWWMLGDESALPDAAALAGHAIALAHGTGMGSAAGDSLHFEVGPLASATGRDAFMAAVVRAIEYIRAGDVFQVNLSHRLSAEFRGSPRGLTARLLRHAGPWYGAYLEHLGPGVTSPHVLCSVSPELFLQFEARSGRVVTRPIKGTRAGLGRAQLHALRDSDKDRAELNMIVDLMRNDLGRVCQYGSVRVEDPRSIESHGVPTDPNTDQTESRGAVQHGVATISGTARPGVGIADILAASFPPGSITGAPKVRAMQIIDELEPVKRGPYCGCIGWIDDTGSSTLSVAIRTAALSFAPGATPADPDLRGVLDYSVGAGIVADSVPADEWAETLQKAGVLLAALGRDASEVGP